jgi:hypothetical protein
VATLSTLSDRLRTELGDLGKSFVHQIVADGITNRFLLPYSPVNGAGLVVSANGVDISTTVVVEEHTGYVTFDVMPVAGTFIVFAGTYYRYFTDSEIQQFVTEALSQHNAGHSDGYGRPVGVDNLPQMEEYPVVVQATTLALYTLATDAAFDIDIIAPDGVNIPRSERFRQVMQMVMDRQEQYKTLCSQLGIGMYKVDVFSLRRISKTTNRYVPVYLPMEVDDRSMPQRAIIAMPTYGSQIVPSTVQEQDFAFVQGDSFVTQLVFPFDVTGYDWKASIVTTYNYGPAITYWNIHQVDSTTLELSLTSEQTTMLPQICKWDIQAKTPSDTTYEQTYMRGNIYVTPQATV